MPRDANGSDRQRAEDRKMSGIRERWFL